MFRSGDPIDDFNRYDAEQARELEKLPVCVERDQPIQEPHFFEINGECVCRRCLIDNHRKNTEDYIE